MEDPSKIEEKASGTKTPEKKLKKKKKKLTAKEKQLEKLEKLSQKLFENSEKLNEFLRFLAFWLKDKQKVCYTMLTKQVQLTSDAQKALAKAVAPKTEDDDDDEDDDEEDDANGAAAGNFEFKINYENFKLVMQDVFMPASRVELHLLCKLLDTEGTGLIDYRKLTPDYVKTFINHEFEDGIRHIKSAVVIDRAKSALPSFEFRLWKPLTQEIYPRYVKLDLKLVTFATERDFPGHIKDEIIHSHADIFYIISLIKKRTDIAARSLSLFKDTSRSKTSRLEDNKTLEEYGFVGGPYESPREYTIFYDYVTLFREDAVINCDFYFLNKKRTK